METNCKKILVLAIAIVITLTALPCRAGEKEANDLWGGDDDRPKREHKWFKLTDEAIERVMNEVAESNPQEAEELAKLQKENPDEFRKVIRERLSEKFREHMKKRMGEHMQPGMEPGMGPGRMMPGMGHGGWQGKGGRMLERTQELLEWLEKNSPEEAEKLADLKEAKPELYMRQLGLSMKRYGKIVQASKENPELAEVLKADLELKDKRDELLRQIAEATEDGEKQKLTAELEKVVSSRFDLIVKRKQIEYEQLREQLKKLEKEVRKNEAEVEKWKDADFKSENVKTRVKELVAKTEKFKWE